MLTKVTPVVSVRFLFSSCLVWLAVFNCLSFGQSKVGSQPVKEIPTADDSRIFVREGGWAIPNYGLTKQDSFVVTVKAEGDRKVRLKGAIYDFSEEIVTDEPLRELGYPKYRIRYTKLFEYKIRGRVFCYKLLYSYVSIGVDFFFAYYDEDGDGNFETLVIGETVGGVSIASNIPHIPEWVLADKTKKRR